MGGANDEDIEAIPNARDDQLNTAHQQIIEQISNLKDDIESAKHFGADIRIPINILNQAESALTNNDFKTTSHYLELCQNAINKSKTKHQNAIDEIEATRRIIEDSNHVGLDLDKAEKMMAKAKEALEKNDYKSVVLRTKSAQKELERVAEIAQQAKDSQGHTEMMIKSIDLKIKQAKESGIIVDDAKKYLEKAKTALTKSKLEIAQKFAKTAASKCRELQKEYEKAQENLQNLRTLIDNSKKLVDIDDVEKLYGQSEMKNKQGDYSESLKLINVAFNNIKYTKKNTNPSLTLTSPEAFTLTSGSWSKCRLDISNEGKVHAHDIKLKISDEIESSGHQELENLNAGEKQEIEIRLKSEKIGELPFNVEVSYVNPITSEQLESKITIWVNVEPATVPGVLGPDKLSLAHLTNKATLSLSKRGDEYEVGLKTTAEEGEASEVFEFIKVSPASRTDLINQINDIVTFSNIFFCEPEEARENKDGDESKKNVLLDNIESLSSLGSLMYGMFLSVSVQKHLKNIKEPLLLKTNDNEIPWEILNNGKDFICLKVPFGRQLRSRESSRVNSVTERDKISFLFIVNATGDLESAEKEVDYITSKLGSDVEIKVLKKSMATNASILSALQSGSYDIIHYAGHAEFNSKAPDESALITADKNKIYAQEIKRLLGGKPLVFLNACGSGREKICEDGKSYTGSDTEGLASSFILGGALAFIGASWPVHDVSSGKLASEFYKHFLLGESVGDSLLMARNHLKKTRAHDINWAAFMLYGDPTIKLRKKIEA